MSQRPLKKLKAATYFLQDPRSLLTWNVNGLAPRSKVTANLIEFEKLLKATEYPDVICIQEARLKRSPSSVPVGGEPSDPEVKAAQPFLDICRRAGYQSIWSLAEGRQAGTLSLVHNRLSQFEKASDIRKYCAFTLEGALELLADRYNVQGDAKVKRWIEELTEKTNSPPTKAKKQGPGKQKSMAHFFKPVKKTATPTSDANSNSKLASKHTSEGRIQFLSFLNLDVLNTYVPNNGTKEESFTRRRRFDERMLSFLNYRNQLLQLANQERPICWLGDLNVARSYLDGTHFELREDGSAYEFWTDESKCFSVFDKRGPRGPDDLGIPGFTNNERRRFEEIVKNSNLVDVWRHLHPTGTEQLPRVLPATSTCKSKWDLANYTWRGTLGKERRALYQGRGQRIDYFMMSPDAVKNVKSCDILGFGELREGFFCGSDHCPVHLRMVDPPAKVAASSPILTNRIHEFCS